MKIKIYYFIYFELTVSETVDGPQNSTSLPERVVNEGLTVVNQGLTVDDPNHLGDYFGTIANF